MQERVILVQVLNRLVMDRENGWLCPGQIILLRWLQGSWEPLQWLPER